MRCWSSSAWSNEFGLNSQLSNAYRGVAMSEPLPDPFEFMKKLWNPMGLPMPGMVAPTLDLDAVEKKIADLKSVENWLNLNLNMLRLSIQGLEMQRNTLAAMKVMQPAPAEAAADAGKNPF